MNKSYKIFEIFQYNINKHKFSIQCSKLLHQFKVSNVNLRPIKFKVTSSIPLIIGSCHGGDCMVVGFITTYAIIAINFVSLNPTHGEVYSIPHYVIKYASGRSVIFPGNSGFLDQLNCQPRYNWNIVESGANHHKPKHNPYLLLIC